MSHIQPYSHPSQMEDETVGTTTTILTPESPMIEQPTDIKTKLKNHQRALIHYCIKLEHSEEYPLDYNLSERKYEINTNIGIIGDVVGSGKTLSILGLIESTHDTVPRYNFVDRSDKLGGSLWKSKCVDCPSEHVYNTSFIIIPHTIFKQWDGVIKEQSSIKYIGINNQKTLNKYSTELTSLSDLEKFPVVLISSTFFTKFMDLLYSSLSFTKINIRRFIFDEADTLKIPKYFDCMARIINPMFTWMVSSTYRGLLNPYGKIVWKNPDTGMYNARYSYSHGFTKRIQDAGLNNRGYIFNQMTKFTSIPIPISKQFVVKNDDIYVNQAFMLESPKETIIKCKMPLSLKVLSNVVSGEILNHINAGDISGALDKLDCDKVSEKDLINAVTKDLHSKLENKKIEYEMNSKMSWSSEAQKQEILEKIQEKIHEIELKIENVKDKLEEATYCNICFDDLTCTSIAPCCNTKFCLECITKWVSSQSGWSTCPFCRAPFNLNDLIIVDEDGSKRKVTKEELISKFDNIEQLLKKRRTETPNPKILIFSDFSNTFDKITDTLTQIGMKYSKIMGTTATINKKIEQYKHTTSSDNIDCLLLNADYCASGLNLENTTDIIIAHKMSTEKTQQIIGRGQRPGREGILNVWKLYYETELD